MPTSSSSAFIGHIEYSVKGVVGSREKDRKRESESIAVNID